MNTAIEPYPSEPTSKHSFAGKSIKLLREERAALIDTMKAGNEAGRYSQQEFNALMGRVEQYNDAIKRGECLVEPIGGSQQAGIRQLVDQTGQRMYMLEPGAKFAQVADNGPEKDCEYPIGEFCKAKALGVDNTTPGSIKAALGTGGAAGESYTIPPSLSADVIDLARARSVLIQAGVQTIAMTTDNHSVARLLTEPVMSEKIENDSFAETTLTIGAINMRPRMIGCLVKASREVVEDSPNIAQLIEDSMAKAMAAEIDNLGLNGTGGQSILGILNYDEIPETSGVGTLTHTALADAGKEVRLENYVPGAALMSVGAKHKLDMSKDSEGRWLGPPPNLTFSMLDTTSLTDANVLVGQFDYFAWAIRQGVQVEVSREAGTAFENHQVFFKIYFRADTALLRAEAFHKLSGVTL